MLIPFVLALQLHATSTVWKVYDHARVAWRPGAPAYEVLFEERVVPRDSDPDHRIRIRVPGRHDFTVIDARGPGGFVPVREALQFAARGLVPRELRDSSRVLLLPAHGPHVSAIFALFGYAYASDPNELTLVGFDSTGYPRVLFRHDFDLREVADLDADGAPEVIGRPSKPQSYGTCSETYDPFAVYRLSGGELRYDLTLSRRYNEAHYVWAGPEMSEKIEIAHCTGARPRVVGREP